MMRFLRSQSQTVLIVVLAVIGFGFLFYGNAGTLLTSTPGRVHGDYGKIDGEDLTGAQLYDAIRNTRDAFIIQGRGADLNQPGANAEIAEEAWRQLLLLHEADRLHIQVSDKQLIDFIHGMSIFQKNGVYSPEEFQTQLTNIQNNLHISPDMFEAILRKNLLMEATRNALFSGARVSALDIPAQYERYSAPVQVSLVSFDLKSFANSAQITPDAIQAEYKAHPENPAYRTKEKRKVDYVLLELTPEQAKLPAKDKSAAKNALGEKALNFVVSLQPDPAAAPGNMPPADFIEGAKKLGLTPKTTDFFTVETPPAGLPPSTTFNNTAFSLTKDNPISKVAEMDNGVVVMNLKEIQPSDLRPLEEVKPEIVKALQQTQGAQAMEEAAKKAAQQLKAIVGKGTDFKNAAAALNLKVETRPSFVPTQVTEKDAGLRAIAYAVTTVPVGGVSDPVPGENDTILIVHLDSRGKADPAGLAKFETQYRGQEEQHLHIYAYIDWANWQSNRPGTRKPPNLNQYGSTD